MVEKVTRSTIEAERYIEELRDDLDKARLYIVGLITANKSLADSNEEWAKQVKGLRNKHTAMVKELRDLHEVLHDSESGDWCHYCDEPLSNCDTHWILDKYKEKK